MIFHRDDVGDVLRFLSQSVKKNGLQGIGDVKSKFGESLISKKANDQIHSLIGRFKEYDFGGTNIQIYLNSIVYRDEKLAVMAADQINVDGEELILATGFKLSEGQWLEKVKNGVGCDVTIFNGNLRYSTTLGPEYIGTAMSDEVKRAVLDNGTVYHGQVIIKDEPYYVSYSPMYDVNHTLVGAFFAGINVSEVNNEFGFVRTVMILSGIVISAVCVVIIMRFAYKQIWKGSSGPLNAIRQEHPSR